MKKKVVAIVGMCGSGKSVATEALKELGWSYVYFGQVTMDQLAQRGMEVTPDNERHVREELRRVHGMSAYAKLLYPTIAKHFSEGPVVLDGLYSWSEYRLLKEKLGEDMVVMAIISDRALRYDRLARRAHRGLTQQQAQERDYAEIENMEKGGPIAIADTFILNNGSAQQLQDAVRSFVQAL